MPTTPPRHGPMPCCAAARKEKDHEADPLPPPSDGDYTIRGPQASIVDVDTTGAPGRAAVRGRPGHRAGADLLAGRRRPVLLLPQGGPVRRAGHHRLLLRLQALSRAAVS